MKSKTAPLSASARAADLLQSIRDTPAGLTLAELLAQRPGVARRTVQRWLGRWTAEGRVVAQGQAPARRYERSTQGYLAIKQDLAEPDPMRLAYRDVIKQTVPKVVMRPGEYAMSFITQAVAAQVPRRTAPQSH